MPIQKKYFCKFRTIVAYYKWIIISIFQYLNLTFLKKVKDNSRKSSKKLKRGAILTSYWIMSIQKKWTILQGICTKVFKTWYNFSKSSIFKPKRTMTITTPATAVEITWLLLLLKKNSLFRTHPMKWMAWNNSTNISISCK